MEKGKFETLESLESKSRPRSELIGGRRREDAAQIYSKSPPIADTKRKPAKSRMFHKFVDV